MKRLTAYLVSLILIAGAAGAVWLAAGTKNTSDKKSTTSNLNATTGQTASTQKAACNIFTLADAKVVLGDTAKGGTSGTNASSSDLAVSACSYMQNTGSNVPVSGAKSASLLVRAPKTERGIASNQNQFGLLKPTDAQDVSGYGDKAYWDPQYGQLDILKNNTWYVLSYGPITPADRTLDQTRQLADILISEM